MKHYEVNGKDIFIDKYVWGHTFKIRNERGELEDVRKLQGYSLKEVVEIAKKIALT